MRIRTQSGGIMQPPKEHLDIDSVVITTDAGDPIVVATSIDNAVCVATINDANFGDYMRKLGYARDKLPAVSVIDMK